MRYLNYLIAIACIISGQVSLGQASKIPKEKIPQPILEQVRIIQADFVSALSRDCPTQGCYARGCVYSNHEVITMQGDQTLPGLLTEGKTRAGGEPQYLLTGVTCEFAYENEIPEVDVENVSKRVSTKLSNGILKVNVKALAMPPGFDKDNPTAPKLSPMQQIQQALIDHFSWILGVSLALIFLALGVYILRRLGKDSKEAELRHLMLKRKLEMEANIPPAPTKEISPSEAKVENPLDLLSQCLDESAEMIIAHKDTVQAQCMRWLENREFENLAACLTIMSKISPINLTPGPEFLFVADEFKKFTNSYLASTEQQIKAVYKIRNAIALMGQLAAVPGQSIEKLFKVYGPEELAPILLKQPLEAKRCILSLMPLNALQQITRILPPETASSLAESFWKSNRVSLAAIEGWEKVAKNSMASQEILIQLPKESSQSLPVDVSTILSVMLPLIPAGERQRIETLGSKAWTNAVFYPSQLTKLGTENARNVLLSVDAHSLSHWYSLQNSNDQELIWRLLPATYQVQIQKISMDAVDSMLIQKVTRSCGKAINRAFLEGNEAVGSAH